MRLDGGLGVVMHLEGDDLEVTGPDGFVSHRVDQIVEVTLKGGRWSRHGTLTILFRGGETTTIPFMRDRRAEAKQVRGQLMSQSRLPTNSGTEGDRAEIQQRIEELRRRNFASIAQKRQQIAEQVERGVVGPDAQEEFEREAARQTATVEREAEQTMRKLNETVRLLGLGADGP